MAIPEAEVRTTQVPAPLALVNVRRSKLRLAPFRGLIAAALPGVALGPYDDIETTALALVAATIKATPVTSAEKARRIKAARASRKLLIGVFQGLALTGLVPMDEFKAIAKGRGLRDTAYDCVQLAEAFRNHAARDPRASLAD